jgi:hypothetical protein
MLTKWHICDNVNRWKIGQLFPPNSPAIPLPTGSAGTNFSLPPVLAYPVKPMISNGFRARRAISKRKKTDFFPAGRETGPRTYPAGFSMCPPNA